MQLDEVIEKINYATEQLDFSTVRRYVESNYEILESYKHLLTKNAREILNLVTNRLETGHPPLSRPQMVTINSINQYAKNLNIRGIKIAVKNNPKLFAREDIVDYFNKDAKIILEGMGTITS
jgi:hypothetical protein